MTFEEALSMTAARAKLLLRHQEDVDGYREVKEAVVDLKETIEDFVMQAFGSREGKDRLKQHREKQRRAKMKRLGLDPGPDLSALSKADRHKIETRGGIIVPPSSATAPKPPEEADAVIFVG
jgi:hypothetical protein